MGRAPCCDERVALKKGPWTPDEDQKLVAYIQQHGHGSWRNLPERAGTYDRVHARWLASCEMNQSMTRSSFCLLLAALSFRSSAVV